MFAGRVIVKIGLIGRDRRLPKGANGALIKCPVF